MRQGDPLSPMFFIAVIEYLSRMAEELVQNGIIDGFRKSNREGGLVIPQLQFTDDTMFFLDANKDNADALKNLFIWFEMVSGLRINLHRFKLFKVRKVDRFEKLTEILGCGIEIFPYTNLGLPFWDRSLSVPKWEKVLDKVATSLASRKTKC